jgi:hypothetical protein
MVRAQSGRRDAAIFDFPFAICDWARRSRGEEKMDGTADERG